MRKIVCVLFLLLAGCAVKETEQSAPNQLRIAYRASVVNLDPIAENTVISDSIYSNIYEPLVVRDENLKLSPALAEDWSNPDDLTWIFKLRPRVLFHDGSEMTAQDVQHSIDRARNNPGSQIAASLASLDRVEIPDPSHIKLITRTPCSTMLNRLVDIWIVKERNGHPVGTGPYKVVSWKPGAYVQLQAHSGYWGGKPPLEAIRFEAVPDLRTRLQSLIAGNVQILPLLEPEALGSIAATDLKKISIQTSSSLATLFLGMDLWREKTPYTDTEKNPFQDLRVRQAIYHAINIDRIVSDILMNYATPATQIVAPKVFGFNEDLQRLPYDPARARKLLAEAGYPQGFSVRLDLTNNRYRSDTQVGRAIVQDLAAVGIRVKLNEQPMQEFVKLLDSRDSSLFMFGFTLPSTDASGAFDFVIHTRDAARGYGVHNGGGYSNPAVDKRIEDSSQIMNPVERARALTEIMKLVMDDLPLIPLHVENSVSASAVGVQWASRPDEFIYCKHIRMK